MRYIKPNLLFLFLPLAFMPDFAIELAGSFFGTIGYLMIKGRRKTAILNASFIIRDKFNKKTAKKIARKSFKNFVANTMYAIKFYFRSEDYLKKHIKIENNTYKLSDLDGGIAVFSHLGNWELIPQIACYMHLKGSAIYRPIDSPLADKLIKIIRKKGKIALIPKKGAVLKSMALLREGYFVGIDGDQNVSRNEGIESDFLGLKTYTSKLPALLAIRSRKKIYPIFLISERPGHYRFIVEQEIVAPENLSNDLAIREITEKINRIIGEYVAKYPDQWLLMHRRWKNRENELKSVFRKLSR